MKSIELISIPVTDQQRAKEFYMNIGFTLLNESPFGNGQLWIQLAPPGGGAGITLVTWFDKMPAGCIQGFIVATDNLEADIEHIKSKGITVSEIEQTPWGRFLYVRDPDGNTVSLHQP